MVGLIGLELTFHATNSSHLSVSDKKLMRSRLRNAAAQLAGLVI